MPAGMKPLEKFLKKQTNALTRAGGFGEKATGTGASRRRASLSRVVPFFRETSPESGPAREVFSPETEEAPCWPSATADIRSPSLSSDEQSSEASLDTNWTPLPADTAENLTLALLDSVAGKRYTTCTGEIMLHSQVFSGGSLESRSFAVVYWNSVYLRCCGALGWVTHNNSFCEAWLSRLSADRYIFSLLFCSLNSLSLYFDIHPLSYIFCVMNLAQTSG